MTSMGSNSAAAAFGRVYWLMIGPMLLLLLAFHIARTGNGWFTTADYIFGGMLVVLPLARWLEFRGGHPKTNTGEPASESDLQQYFIAAPLVGIAIWVLANLVGNYWLAP